MAEHGIRKEGETLMSFVSFEISDMLPDCQGWLEECTTRKRYWCVAAGNMLGLFGMPESDKPSIVLSLTEFMLDTCSSIQDLEKLSICGLDVDSVDFGKDIVLILKSVINENKYYAFRVAKEEVLIWKNQLQSFAASAVSKKEKMIRQERLSSEEANKMDSVLGKSSNSARWSGRSKESSSPEERRRFPKQMSTDSYSDWDIISSEHELNRGSSSVTTNDDLTDSHSMSDSASLDNISTTCLSAEVDFANSETASCGRLSLNDSVFLGTSLDSSKDGDGFASDDDSAVASPHQTASPGTTDYNKTVIGKVSKLVQRALVRRPRVSSGLTLGHLPNLKMSGRMRRKGKSRWYALSGTCLYSFKNNLPDTEAEAILDLALYSVALATEKKEDGQSIGLLKLTHSTGKKVLFSVNSTLTAQEWFDSISDAIHLANTSKVARSDSGKSNSSNPDSHGQGQGSLSNRLSRESFEDSYGYFERRSSLRAERDAVQNAATEVKTNVKQNVQPLFTAWGACDDLVLHDKRSKKAAFQFAKHSLRSSLLFKRNVRQMSIPAADVVDPTLMGYLHVSTQGKGSWKKYWVVLKDDWLYFYKKPTDPTTSDIIDLTNYTVHRERTFTNDLPLAQQRLIFSIAHSDGSNRVLLMATSAKETRDWMEKTKHRTKRKSMVLDGLNLESGSTTRQLPDLDATQTELHKQHLLMEVLQQNQLPMIGQQRASDKAEPSVGLDDPELEKRRKEILTKYQKANDEEEEDLVRMMTILNRRRMSAQVKKDALQKRIGRKTKRRVARIGSIEETEMEEQIRVLNEKLKSISSEINAKSSQKTNKLQALKLKKELELQLLEQQERLSRYRRLAQTTLQDALVGLDEESPNSGGSGEETPETKSSHVLSPAEVDETDNACKVTERETEKICEDVSPSHYRKLGERSPSKSPRISPIIQSRRLLPVTPEKTRDNPMKAIPPSSKRDSQIVDKNVNTEYSKDLGSEPPAQKKTSPLMRFRKKSVESIMSQDKSQSSTGRRERKLSLGMTKAPSFDEGLSLLAGKLKPSLRPSSSTTDLQVLADSPIPRRATDGDKRQPPTASPQKRRRKISVPIKMPSMENLFATSSAKKEKTRKSSIVNAPFPSTSSSALSPADGAQQKQHSHSLGSVDYPTQRNSPDINGNCPPRGIGESGRLKKERQPVKDEIDPDVLRDIEEFEMMARKALQEEGWLFRS